MPATKLIEIMLNHRKGLIALILLLLSGCGSSSLDLKRMQEAQQQLLGGQFSEKTFELIIRYTSSDREVTRANACASLAAIALRYGGDVEARVSSVLTHALSDSSQAVRRTAAESFSDLSPGAIKEAEKSLVECLREGNDVSWFATEALARLGKDGAPVLPALLKALETSPPASVQDEAPQLRIFAAKALGQVGVSAPEIVLPVLKKAMTNQNPFFALEAAKAVRTLDLTNAESLAIINEFTNSPRSSLREDATHFLRTSKQ